MTLKVFIIALLTLLIGLAFCFAGYRFFRILIAIWGFFLGFLLGATGVAATFGGGFLSTVLGWVIGIVVGLVLGMLAYLLYKLAVVILGASVGYWIGTGVMTAIGFSGQQFLTELVGIIVAVVLAILIIALNLPKILIMVFTAMGGARNILAGVLLLLGRIPLGGLQYGAAEAVIRNSLFWSIAWIVLAAAGFVVQLQSVHDYNLEWSQSRP
jgi:hypothetical protein